MVVAALVGVREARTANPERVRRLTAAVLALGACFALIVLGWGLAG